MTFLMGLIECVGQSASQVGKSTSMVSPTAIQFKGKLQLRGASAKEFGNFDKGSDRFLFSCGHATL